MRSLYKPKQVLVMGSLKHLLAGLATGPFLFVARTLSYLLGNHTNETFSVLRLSAQMSAGLIIVAALVKYFEDMSSRWPRTCRMRNPPKLLRLVRLVPRGETEAWVAAR